MKMLRILPSLIFIFLASCSGLPKDKTVFIPILARNQAHYLPRYLKNLENFDYDKKLITIYINTNNNEDQTEEILRAWAKKNEKKYRSILFEAHQISSLERSSHAWTPQRLKTIGQIRNKSLEIAKKSCSDYYFVSDCDNFVAPYALKTLIAKDKPIIAPLLYDIPDKDDRNANYYSSVDDRGYFLFDRFYYPVFFKKLSGVMKVPVVHCTYLVNSKYLDKLSYVDGTDDSEFVIFSRTARANGVDQFICNEKDFGVQFAFLDKELSLNEEIKITRPFLSLP